MRTAFGAIAILGLISASVPTAKNERFQLDGHTYYLHAPAKDGRVAPTKAVLFVWLHSGGIGAKVQFDWWVASRMFDQDMILLCPQAAAVSNDWNVAADKAFLDKLVAQVAGEYKVAADRVILGGHSLGGAFAWYWMFQNQDRFAGFLACSCIVSRPIPKALKQGLPPILYYYSENDPYYPMAKPEQTVDDLKKNGFAVTVVKDNVRHDLGVKARTCLADLRKLVDAQIAAQRPAGAKK